MTTRTAQVGPTVDAGVARVHLGTLLTWVLLSLLGVYLVFVVGGFPGIYQVQWRLVTHGLTLALIVGWLLALLWRPDLFVMPRLTLPIAVILGAMIVSTIASPYPRFGWETVLNAAATALVFAALVTVLADPGLRPRLRFTAAALVIGVVIAYAVQVIFLWIDFWSLVGHLAVPPLRPAFAGLVYGTPNIPAGFVVVFLPLVLAWIEGSTIRAVARRVALGVLVVVGLFDLVASGSRGAQLGFAVAILVGGILMAIRHRGRLAALGRRLSGRRAAAVVGISAVVLLVAAVWLAPRILARAGDTGVNLRLTFWQHSLAAFTDAPLTGTGPGTWAFAQWAYRNDVSPLDIVAHAHNAPIQLAAEMGLVGLVAGTILVVGVVVLLRRAWRELPGLEVIAVAMGLVGVAAQCLVDNFSDLPLFVGGVAFLLAWVEGGMPARMRMSRTAIRAAAGGTLVAIAIVSSTVVLPWDRAARAHLDGVTAQDAGDWPAAAAAFTTAVELDPDYPHYRAALGVAADWAGHGAMAAEQLAIGARMTGDPFMETNAALALLGAGGAHDEAAELLAEATDAGAVNVDLALNAGAIAERLGRPEDAAHHYATAIALQPDLAGSAYWRDPSRPLSPEAQVEAALTRLHEMANVDVDPTSAAITAWAGMRAWDRATEAANTLPAGIGRDANLAWLTAMQGDPSGLEALRAINDETSGAVVSLLASAADHLGDPQADRYRAWTAIVASGSDRAGRATVLAQGGGEAAAYLDLGPAIAEEVYLRDRGIITQVRDAIQVAQR
jgi:O-antigen ligase/tetratricopeptide (TPR) repeat protein